MIQICLILWIDLAKLTWACIKQFLYPEVFRYSSVKAKYLDARSFLIEKWKAARAAAGHSTKISTKARKPSPRGAKNDARESDASATVRKERLSDVGSAAPSQRSTQRSNVSNAPPVRTIMSSQPNIVRDIETDSQHTQKSVQSKRSVSSIRSTKAPKIVKPKVKKIVPTPPAPNPDVTTQEISGDFL